MYRLYHSLAILILFSIIYCDEISSQYIEPSLIFEEFIRHDIGTSEEDRGSFVRDIVDTRIKKDIVSELSTIVNPEIILLEPRTVHYGMPFYYKNLKSSFLDLKCVPLCNSATLHLCKLGTQELKRIGNTVFFSFIRYCPRFLLNFPL